jgi:general secretion pathway protein G
MNKNKEKGFTLVELMVVMMIIGILAVMIVPRFTGRTKEAKITAAKNDIKAISAALEMYEKDNDIYPTTEQGLEALIKKPTSDPQPTNWHQYLPSDASLKDPWGNPYQYKCPGDHNPEYFDLWSFGPDRKEGTEDDIVNWRKE